MKFSSKVLTTEVFPPEDAKTGDNIRREIIRLLTEYNVLNKVVWVMEQSSNVMAALRPYRQLDCQDHQMQVAPDIVDFALHYFTREQKMECMMDVQIGAASAVMHALY